MIAAKIHYCKKIVDLNDRVACNLPYTDVLHATNDIKKVNCKNCIKEINKK